MTYEEQENAKDYVQGTAQNILEGTLPGHSTLCRQLYDAIFVLKDENSGMPEVVKQLEEELRSCDIEGYVVYRAVCILYDETLWEGK